jgi:hypothetical protein
MFGGSFLVESFAARGELALALPVQIRKLWSPQADAAEVKTVEMAFDGCSMVLYDTSFLLLAALEGGPCFIGEETRS